MVGEAQRYEEVRALLKSLTQTYTISVFWLGFAAAVILRFGFHDQTEPLLGIFYTQFLGWEDILDQNFGRFVVITCFGVAGLGIMWLSSRLDFVDPEPDLFRPLAVKSVKAIVFVWLFAAFIAFGYYQTVASIDDPWATTGSHWTEIPIGLFMAIYSLSLLILMWPFSFVWWVFPVLCLGWSAGGVLSSVRAVTFLMTRHKLRDTYERGQRQARFNAHEVSQYLGGKSTSQAHSRALLKDAVGLLDESKSRAAELNTELDGLSQKVKDDAQRLKVEAELSQILAEIEDAKIKIDVLKKRAGG